MDSTLLTSQHRSESVWLKEGQTKMVNSPVQLSLLLFSAIVQISNSQRWQWGEKKSSLLSKLESVFIQDTIFVYLGQVKWRQQMFELTWCVHLVVHQPSGQHHVANHSLGSPWIQSKAKHRLSQARVCKASCALAFRLGNFGFYVHRNH